MGSSKSTQKDQSTQGDAVPSKKTPASEQPNTQQRGGIRNRAGPFQRPFSPYPPADADRQPVPYSFDDRKSPPLFNKDPKSEQPKRLAPNDYKRDPEPRSQQAQKPPPAQQAQQAQQPVAKVQKDENQRSASSAPPKQDREAAVGRRPPTGRRSATNQSTAKKWYVVIDLKGTIPESDLRETDAAEVIEVSIVIINGATRKIEVDQFHSFVRPTLNPRLTSRCKEVNRGIRQCYIDKEESDWTDVLGRVEAWLDKYKIPTEINNFSLIADSSYEKLIRSQCSVSSMSVPAWAAKYANLRNEFSEVFGRSESLEKLNVYRMLEIAKLNYVGVPYDGNDECYNLALVASNMLQKGAQFDAVQCV